MNPIITDSARKRGYADEDLLFAFDNALFVADVQQDGPTMVVGPLRDGRLVEIGFKVAAEGVTVIFHAMPVRKRYEQPR